MTQKKECVCVCVCVCVCQAVLSAQEMGLSAAIPAASCSFACSSASVNQANVIVINI